MSFRQTSQRYFSYERFNSGLRVGLVGHWIGFGSGLTLPDYSGYLGHGTLRNGAFWDLGREHMDHAVAFDGVNDSVDSPTTSTGSKLSALGQSFTLACWVFTYANTGAAQMFICKPHAPTTHADPYFTYALYYDNASSVLRMAVDTTGLPFVVSTNAVGGTIAPFGQWFHFAGTYDGANMTIYLNGVFNNSNVRVGNVVEVATPVRLGANGANGEVLNGKLSDVRIYNRVLSLVEIALLANPSNFPVVSSDLRHGTRSIVGTTFRPWIMYS